MRKFVYSKFLSKKSRNSSFVFKNLESFKLAPLYKSSLIRRNNIVRSSNRKAAKMIIRVL